MERESEAVIVIQNQKLRGRSAPAKQALLTLLTISAQSACFGNEVVAFGWSESDDRFSLACAPDGIRALWDGEPDSWLSGQPGVISALKRGEDVSFSGRLLLPIVGPSLFEGMLSIAGDAPLTGEARANMQKMCALAALVLSGLRERDEAIETISTVAQELGTPLAAARGYTRMVLEDIRNSAGSHSEYLSEALKNINRLGEVAVGLLHAGADG